MSGTIEAAHIRALEEETESLLEDVLMGGH